MSRIETVGTRTQATNNLFGKLAVAALTAVLIPLAAAPAARADSARPEYQQLHRQVWVYEGGFVTDRGGGQWEDRTPTHLYQYEEVARHRSYIELYDRGRDVRVRLFGDASYSLRPNPNQSGFVRCKTGHWRD
jgi:hypothetical protein